MELQVTILQVMEKVFENKILLTKRDVAYALGVSVGTVTNLVKEEKIPYIKFGGKASNIRFDIAAIATWIENGNPKTRVAS